MNYTDQIYVTNMKTCKALRDLRETVWRYLARYAADSFGLFVLRSRHVVVNTSVYIYVHPECVACICLQQHWRLAWCIFFMNSAPSVTRAKVRSPSANVSISSVLVKRPYFLRLLSVPSLSPPLPLFPPSRAISGRKWSENREALFSPASRRTKRRHDSPSLRNLTNFRSTST